MIRIADRYVLDKLTISRALGGLHYGVTEDLFASKSRLTQNFPQADFWPVWPSVVQLPDCRHSGAIERGPASSLQRVPEDPSKIVASPLR